jgi:hypothetical protein
MNEPIWNPIIYAGAKWTATVRFRDSNGDLVDVSGYTFYMDFVSKPGGRKYASPTISNNGTYLTLVLTPTESAKLSAPQAYFDLIQINNSDSTDKTLRMRGEATIIPIATVTS